MPFFLTHIKPFPRFPNKLIAGLVNYELMMDWLEERRQEGRPKKEEIQLQQKVPIPDSPMKQAKTIEQPARREAQRERTNEEDRAVSALSRALGRQKVELEKLSQVMRSKDHYGNDQLSGQQVSASLRAVGLTVERSAMTTWLRTADTIGKGIYSIPGLLDILGNAVKRARGEDGRQNKERGSREERSEGLVAAPLTNNNTREEDLSWHRLLDLNSSLPKVTLGTNIFDGLTLFRCMDEVRMGDSSLETLLDCEQQWNKAINSNKVRLARYNHFLLNAIILCTFKIAS